MTTPRTDRTTDSCSRSKRLWAFSQGGNNDSLFGEIIANRVAGSVLRCSKYEIRFYSHLQNVDTSALIEQSLHLQNFVTKLATKRYRMQFPSNTVAGKFVAGLRGVTKAENKCFYLSVMRVTDSPYSDLFVVSAFF